MPTKMIPRFQWDSVYNPHTEEGVSVIEIAAAPIMDDLRSDIMDRMNGGKKVYVFFNGEEKPYGYGEPASNFRSKESSETNNRVVDNIQRSIEFLQDTDVIICLSSYPRDERLFTFTMTEEGKFDITQKGDVDVGNCSGYNHIFQEFLTMSNITDEHIKKIRLTSESAGFRTMMADILSMLIQVDVINNGNITGDKNLSFNIYRPGEKDKEGEIMLRDMTLPDGKEWSPVEGNNYLYINQEDKTELKPTKVPVTGSNLKIFDNFWKLLNCEENEVKKSIREHYTNINNFYTFRDYCVNDTDDAFTIISILHAFKFHGTPTESELNIIKQFENIIKPWYDELDI